MDIKIDINIKENIAANLFLRALWAKFRQEFSLDLLFIDYQLVTNL